MKNWIYLMIIMSIAACSRSPYPQLSMHPAPIDAQATLPVQDSCTQWDLTYIGDAYDYIIFECQLINHCAHDFSIRFSDFSLIPADTEGFHTPSSTAINPKEQSNHLQQVKKSVKKDRKTKNILNGILLGLQVITTATVPGANIAESIIYGTENIAYMIDDNNALKDYERNLRDESLYFKSGVLHQANLSPGDTIVRDIVFKHPNQSGRWTVRGYWNGHEHIKSFSSEIK